MTSEHFELQSGRESAEFTSLGVVRGVAKCCLVELSANKLGVLVDSFLEPMQLYSTGFDW